MSISIKAEEAAAAVFRKLRDSCKANSTVHILMDYQTISCLEKSIWGQLEKNQTDPHYPRSTGVSLPQQQYLAVKTQLDQDLAGSTPFPVLLEQHKLNS